MQAWHLIIDRKSALDTTHHITFCYTYHNPAALPVICTTIFPERRTHCTTRPHQPSQLLALFQTVVHTAARACAAHTPRILSQLELSGHQLRATPCICLHSRLRARRPAAEHTRRETRIGGTAPRKHQSVHCRSRVIEGHAAALELMIPTTENAEHLLTPGVTKPRTQEFSRPRRPVLGPCCGATARHGVSPQRHREQMWRLPGPAAAARGAGAARQSRLRVPS